MSLLHPVDLAVMATYFGVLLWIGFAVMRLEKKGSGSVSAETCAVENSDNVCGKTVESMPHVSHG